MASEAQVAFGEGDRLEETAELLPIQTALYASVKDARAKIDKGDLQKGDAVDAISESFYLQQKAVVELIDRQITKHKARWEGEQPDAAQQTLDGMRWERRYSTYTKEALQAEVETYRADDHAWPPDRIEILLASIVRAEDTVLAAALRQIMNRRKYDQPWLAAPDVKPLVKLRDLHSAPYGQTRVLSPFGEMDVAIKELFDT